DRRGSRQPSLRYDEYGSFSGHKSPLSIDGSTSPFMMQGAQPQTFDTESLCARINETLVNPDDSRETSLLKQRQFQREYFHPSLANSNVDMTPTRQLAGSHSSRGSDWGQHSGFIAGADTAYDYPHDPNPSTRSRSPSGARPVSSSSASHRTGTSGTSLVIPVPSMTSHTSSVDGPGRRPRVHVPVPDREEPPIFGRYVPAAERKQGLPAVQPESSSGSSSAEEESDDEDGLLYLGRVPRPSKIQLKK
ncbi:translation termination factor GTPase eRF3, partial [Ascosphaera pollenicola]